MNSNDFMYEKITQINLMIFETEESKLSDIEQISFKMGNGKFLFIKVEPNFDEIITETHEDFDINFSDHKIITIDNESSGELSNCIGKSIMWFWTLKNNNRYNDGVEMELHGNNERYSVRFLVECSSIKISVINDINIVA